MGHKFYSALCATLFALAAALHVARLILGWNFQIGPVEIPLAVSWLAVPVALALSIWGYVSVAKSGGGSG